MIGYFEHQSSGCLWYRIKRPMDLLNANGLVTKPIRLNEDVIFEDFHAFLIYGSFPFRITAALQKIKDAGKRIIYDLDDPLTLVDTSNPFYFNVKRDSKSVQEIMKYADHVTVSTPKMAEYARTFTEKPITVIPNCYTPSEWTYKRPEREGIRIGFAGSSTHVSDILLILPAIKNLQKKYPDLKFLLMGFGAPDYQSWFKNYRYSAPEECIPALQEMDRLLAEINFECVPFVEVKDYPSTLINMSLDIGLCPLTDTTFNQHRSACKAMEYTLAGALAIASDISPYQFDDSSVLVKEDWESVIEEYITHPIMLEERRQEHLKWIMQNRKEDSQLEALTKIYGL